MPDQSNRAEVSVFPPVADESWDRRCIEPGCTKWARVFRRCARHFSEYVAAQQEEEPDQWDCEWEVAREVEHD